jgi:predicted metal-dependent phosphoesterase TrpH
MTIDLHLHSTASDGVFSPEELVKKAADLHMTAVALTDHDSVSGVDAAIGEGARREIRIVPAIELSSGLNGRDIHFLGYFIDHRNKTFNEWLVELREMRTARASKMLCLLEEQDMDISLEDVLKVAGNASVGRAHLAQLMVAKGYIDTIEEAFEKYIGRDGSCYVEKYYLSPKDVIAAIKAVGGIAILAHPGLSQVDEFIPDFIRYGIQGIEVMHGEHTPEQTKRYLELTKAKNLLPTGGSDFHGLKNSKRGRKLGTVRVPDEFLERLEKSKMSQASK